MLIKNLDYGIKSVMDGEFITDEDKTPMSIRDMLVDVALFAGLDREKPKVQRVNPLTGLPVEVYPQKELKSGKIMDNYDLASSFREQEDVELSENQVEELTEKVRDIHESNPQICAPLTKLLTGKEVPMIVPTLQKKDSDSK